MASGLLSLIMLVLSSCMLTGGQNCSLSGTRLLVILVHACTVSICLMHFSCFIFTRTFMHAVTQFHFRNVKILSAESVGGTTPGVRVTWNTTIQPECVAAMRVEFRTISRGPVVATSTTTNTSQTEVIQTSTSRTTHATLSLWRRLLEDTGGRA